MTTTTAGLAAALVAGLAAALVAGRAAPGAQPGPGGGTMDIRHATTVSSAALSADGARLATGSSGGDVILWRTAPFAAQARLDPPGGRARGRIEALAFSPGGDRLAIAARDTGKVELWDPGTVTPIPDPPGHGGATWALAFAPGGRLATYGADRAPAPPGGDDDDVPTALGPPVVRLWSDGALLAELAAPPGRMGRLAFSPDGQALALAAPDTVWEWGVADRKVRRQVDLPGEPAWVGWLPDGALCGASSRVVRCWPRLHAVGADGAVDTEGARAPTRAAVVTARHVVTGTFDQVEVRPRGGATPTITPPITVAGRAYAILAAQGDAAWLVFEDRAVVLSLGDGVVRATWRLKDSPP